MADTNGIMDKAKKKASIVKETLVDMKDSVKEGFDKLVNGDGSKPTSRRGSAVSIENGELIKPPEKLGKGKYYLAPTGQLIKRAKEDEVEPLQEPIPAE